MSKSASLPPRYETRPDPTEPWRYKCPDCGCPTLNEYTRRASGRRFKCNGCNGTYGLEALVDRVGGRDG